MGCVAMGLFPQFSSMVRCAQEGVALHQMAGFNANRLIPNVAGQTAKAFRAIESPWCEKSLSISVSLFKRMQTPTGGSLRRPNPAQ